MASQRPFVCIVDDDPSVLAAVERLLRAAEFDVATFDTGEAFVEAFPARRPDCAVVDIHMPLMDGFAVRDEIRLRDADIPVVFVTAHEGERIDCRAAEDSRSVLLRKPFSASRLIGAIVDSITAQNLIRTNQTSK